MKFSFQDVFFEIIISHVFRVENGLLSDMIFEKLYFFIEVLIR